MVKRGDEVSLSFILYRDRSRLADVVESTLREYVDLISTRYKIQARLLVVMLPLTDPGLLHLERADEACVESAERSSSSRALG
ncbi:MAG: hypothetical protein QXU97_03575 [Fervidicoccaceae archaeon]